MESQIDGFFNTPPTTKARPAGTLAALADSHLDTLTFPCNTFTSDGQSTCSDLTLAAATSRPASSRTTDIDDRRIRLIGRCAHGATVQHAIATYPPTPYTLTGTLPLQQVTAQEPPQPQPQPRQPQPSRRSADSKRITEHQEPSARMLVHPHDIGVPSVPRELSLGLTGEALR